MSTLPCAIDMAECFDSKKELVAGLYKNERLLLLTLPVFGAVILFLSGCSTSAPKPTAKPDAAAEENRAEQPAAKPVRRKLDEPKPLPDKSKAKVPAAPLPSIPPPERDPKKPLEPTPESVVADLKHLIESETKKIEPPKPILPAPKPEPPRPAAVKTVPPPAPKPVSLPPETKSSKTDEMMNSTIVNSTSPVNQTPSINETPPVSTASPVNQDSPVHGGFNAD